MTTTPAEAVGTPAGPAFPTQGSAGLAVTRHLARLIRRGALIVALAVAGMSAVVAGQYQSTFAGALDGSALRALAENPAIRILFGPPIALDDPGGFTVWRTGTPVEVLTGVWALLTATRLTRGEEDAGHADLLLGGRLRAVDLLTRCLTALGAAAVVIAAALALAMLVTGTQPTGALVHAGGILGGTVTFAAAGALSAQIMPTRAAATGLAVAALGVSLLLRMLADGIGMLSWAAWVTPFGLTAQTAPYACNRLLPLLVLAMFPILLGAAAVIVASRRDVGRGLLNPSGHRRPKTWLLHSITGFAVRRALRATAGWAAGIAAYFLLIGALLASVLQFMQENPKFAELAAAAGFGSLGTAEGFAAAIFGLVAIPVGLYAVTRIAAFAADESARRSTSLFALPIRRERFAVTELAVTAAGVFALLTTAGLTLWIGASIADAPLDIASAVGGAWNTMPIALLALGAALFALGWAPRAVALIGAVPVVGGFLLNVILQSTEAPVWLTYLTPFGHLAAVPGTPPDWGAIAVLITIAASLAALGVLGYRRRDLNT
ncbi:polyketide antibiotic transporter [Amycolatopsis coloradensis]|uniref:Polyketide antibiotic transporter n=1 Tax=Amycolatopsis coloradensis TaxID=76021 RepID=A0ACD5BP35_9PSEU